ncbi:DUF1559 domain-containing protein [Aeoliella sp.]|uniref:DUF1559 family PulG-like putative transporter n=1 Tax=Aeoliella sp. TaxID=2795800 RepID=UPI003CCBD034
MQGMHARLRGFTLVELLVVIAIIGILVALLLPAVQAARESARRTQCTNQTKQIGLALQMHHDQKGVLPSGRNETRQFGQSWAFQLLPMLEQQTMFDSLVKGERMDSDLNATAMRTPVDVFVCPSRRRPEADRDFDNDDAPTQAPASGALGDYASNAGHRQLVGMAVTSNDSRPATERIIAEISGPIYTYSKIKFRRVIDGLVNTLAIGERHIPEPIEDPPVGEHYWQGDTAFFASDNPDTILGVPPHGLRSDGQEIQPGEGQKPRESFGGPHPGVTLFVFLDGHVAPVDNDTDTITLARLSAIGDGEIIDFQ